VFDASGSGADVDGRTSSEERRSMSLPGMDGSRTVGRSIDIHLPDAISTGEPISAKAWSLGRVEDKGHLQGYQIHSLLLIICCLELYSSSASALAALVAKTRGLPGIFSRSAF
jgi:hypothetical protein